MFKLNSKLEADSFTVIDLKLSRLLLCNDSNYLWLILVPRVDGVIELTDLEFSDQQQLLNEINLVGKVIKEDFNYQKLNIAILGNVVSQLHVHIIGRKHNDISFPKPIWGQVPAKPYNNNASNIIIDKIKELLNEK